MGGVTSLHHKFENAIIFAAMDRSGLDHVLVPQSQVQEARKLMSIINEVDLARIQVTCTPLIWKKKCDGATFGVFVCNAPRFFKDGSVNPLRLYLQQEKKAYSNNSVIIPQA